MTENKVQRMANELGQVNHPFTQNEIFSLILSRIAAGQEEAEPGSERFPFTADTTWKAANRHFAEMTEEDPQKAFEAAVELILLPQTDDPTKEWIKSTGYSVLGDFDFVDKLDDYLESGSRRRELIDLLQTNMNTDVSDLKVPEDYGNPRGFRTAQSVYIGLGLRYADSDSSQMLFRIAKGRRSNTDIKNAIDIIKTFPGCEYIALRTPENIGL